MVFLFALTVPSAPKPKNKPRNKCCFSKLNVLSYKRLVFVISSSMPIVNPFLGFAFVNASKIAFTIPGLNSLEANPYLPPTTFGRLPSQPACNALITSIYKGSPIAPVSLHLSNTAICFTEFGIAFTKCAMEKGRNKCTVR